MSAAKHHVIIKGTKEGLVFMMDDACPFADLLAELRHKLEKTHHKLLSGPRARVYIRLGERVISDAETEELRELFACHSNLQIVSIGSDAELAAEQAKAEHAGIRVVQGIVRSGQVLEHDGNLMLVGDVNPGGMILATGDIYVMGSLQGLAHAGIDGSEEAIIAASHLSPAQLRIAGVISRPPEEWDLGDAYMEFAYIRDGQMQIDKIKLLHRIRPHSWIGEMSG